MLQNFIPKPSVSTITTIALWVATMTPFVLAFKLRRNLLEHKKQIQKSIDSVRYKILFTSLSDKCLNEKHHYRGISCGEKCTTHIIRNICDFINSARYNLIMAVNMITLEEVAECILQAHINGVRVRILCDVNKAAILSSKNKDFVTNGIPIKTNDKDGSEIHSKFCIVDAGQPTAKMLFGTMNLTMQAISMNQEIIMFTNNPVWINMYSKAFDEFWPDWIEYF